MVDVRKGVPGMGWRIALVMIVFLLGWGLSVALYLDSLPRLPGLAHTWTGMLVGCALALPFFLVLIVVPEVRRNR